MMKKYKKILIGTAIVLAALILLPFLIPTQTYLREAEKMASAELGLPVTIGAVRLVFLPSPRVAVSDILVGKNQELKVQQLLVIPTIGSLLSANKTLDLQVTKPIIKKTALDFVSAILAKKSDDNQATIINIRQIDIDALQLIWPGMKLPAMQVNARLEANQLSTATLTSLDGKLKAKVAPGVTPNVATSADEQLIVVNINKWTLPVGLPLLIDNAKLEMHLKDSKLSIPSIDMAMYGGKVTGNAELNWQTNWRLNGKLKIDNLAVQQPSKMLSQSVYLSGKLFANGGFSAKAKSAAQLADRLQANFKFSINNGVLHGLDLVKVASLVIKQKHGGGQTQFDAFSGLLGVSGKQYHLRNLNISSGLLVAKGQVKVKPNKALDGAVVVDVKNGMGLAEIPLDVSGTVSSPIVLPNKAALAGAIAGTAVLPGVGTSIGAKVGAKTGEALNKLKGLFD